MKKTSKYAIGNVFYLQAIKQDVMVVAPTEAGTIVHIVAADDPTRVMKYNIRNHKLTKLDCETCLKKQQSKKSPLGSK
jgi:hypothetical protein